MGQNQEGEIAPKNHSFRCEDEKRGFAEETIDYEDLITCNVILNSNANSANEQITKNRNEINDHNNNNVDNLKKPNQNANFKSKFHENESRIRVFNCIPITLKIFKCLSPNSLKDDWTFLNPLTSNGWRVCFCHCLVMGRVTGIEVNSKYKKYMLDDGTDSVELINFYNDRTFYAKQLEHLQEQLAIYHPNELMNVSSNERNPDYSQMDEGMESTLTNDIQKQQLPEESQENHHLKDQNISKQKKLIKPLRNILHLISLQINEIEEIEVGDNVIVYGKPILFHDRILLRINAISVTTTYNDDGKGGNSQYYKNNYKIFNNTDFEIDFKDWLIDFYRNLTDLTNIQ